MSGTDIMSMGLLGQLKGKMQWHNTRQQVLAQNVANADTPNYRGRDMHAFNPNDKFSKHLSMVGTKTNAGHITLRDADGNRLRTDKQAGYETTPYKNSVTAEEEMLKVTENQMDYQIATTIYQRNLGLIKMAVGRR